MKSQAIRSLLAELSAGWLRRRAVAQSPQTVSAPDPVRETQRDAIPVAPKRATATPRRPNGYAAGERASHM